MSSYEIDGAAAPMDPAGAKLIGFDAQGTPGWVYAQDPGPGPDVDYTIGVPGTLGFGVAPCDPAILPTGFTPLTGTYEAEGAERGNYEFSDGSIMVWIPKFYYRVNNPMNPTFPDYGVNSVDIQATQVDPTYILHRAFIDGGVEKDGVFVDKYQCSKTSIGTGFVASSILEGDPLTISATNPISALTAANGLSELGVCIDVAHGRDGDDGEINPTSRFFCASRFVYGALAMLAMAHGQASTSTDTCAWYDSDGLENYPKGNNSNSLSDIDDPEITFTSSAGMLAKAGSGVPYAKTTHNGQENGIADLNGNLYEVSIGFSCIATSKAIESITKDVSCVIIAPQHGIVADRPIYITGIVGMTQLNDRIVTAAPVHSDALMLIGVDSTTFSTYVSGGTITYGDYYVASETTAMKDYLNADDSDPSPANHFGTAGITANMELIDLPVYASGLGLVAMRLSNPAWPIWSSDPAGPNYVLTGANIAPLNNRNAIGADLFGKDDFYQGIANNMIMRSCGGYASSIIAGINAVRMSGTKTLTAGSTTGFRLCAYTD